jgi:hypothetical protein
MPSNVLAPFRMDYTAQQSTGVSILVVVSLLSFVAVLVLLLAIALSAFNTRHSHDRFLFVRTHAAAYFLSLMVCWLIQCTASIMSSHWLKDNIILSGNFCNIQGALKHVADVGLAVWTLVMAGNTFSHLFLEMNPKRYVMWIVLVSGWIFTGIVVGAGPAIALSSKNRGPFYNINGVWCSISPDYEVQVVTLGYLLILLSAVLSAILYGMTFLRIRGNIVRNGWAIKFRRVRDTADKYYSNDKAQLVAKQMMLFPVAYAVLILPIAITRFIVWSGKTVPFELTIFSSSVYVLSGFTNVFIFTTTRRILPISSMRIGNWYLVPSSRPSPDGDETDDFAVIKHSSEDGAEKGVSRVVTFAAEPTTIRTPPGRKQSQRRPAELNLAPRDRDSFASMYSDREGVYVPPLSSHWSADTPPLQSRMSVYLQSFASAASKI